MELHMNQDFAVFFLWPGLKTNSQPTMPLVTLRKIYGRNRIGIAKEKLIGILLSLEPLLNQSGFISQHAFEPVFGHVTALFFHAINGIAEVLIIRAHSFCDRIGCCPCPEKMTHGL